jgi:hypothetical protein
MSLLRLDVSWMMERTQGFAGIVFFPFPDNFAGAFVADLEFACDVDTVPEDNNHPATVTDIIMIVKQYLHQTMTKEKLIKSRV